MAEYNHQNIVTKELISEALGGLEIISVKSEPAVPKGEHYLSTLLRVDVTYRRAGADLKENTKMIIKTYPDGFLENFTKQSKLLVRELECYNKILPRLTKVLGRSLTPQTIGRIKSDVLILEDLKLKGFTMADRVERMDFKHCEASVKALADLHASSILACNEDESVFDTFKEDFLYTIKNSFQRKFVLNGFSFMADEFESNPHLQKYSDRLRLAGEKTWEAVVEAMRPKDDELNVFNHGDFWTTNILFRYDGETSDIQEVKLVDFQFPRWTSPAMDLTMFYSTSVRNRDYIPKLTEAYLYRLNEHFTENMLTAEKLEISLKRYHCFGLLLAVCTTPICTMDSKSPLEFENVSSDDFLTGFKDETPNPYRAACKDKRFQEVIPEFLDFFIEIGLL